MKVKLFLILIVLVYVFTRIAKGNPEAPKALPKVDGRVIAGLDTSSELPFTKYSIRVPDRWTVTTDNLPVVPIDTFILTKGEYKLKIYQAPSKATTCDTLGTSYVDLKTVDGIILRRIADGSDFRLCQKTDDTYKQPTLFGHITYTVPSELDTSILKKMDTAISSLTKK